MPTKDYFSDLEGFGSGPALPSSSDTPYQTPRVSMSRRSSRPGTSRGGSSSPPPMPSSSPSPMPASSPATHTHDDYKTDNEGSHHEDVLIDPRRFTPTLHASLVSEILNLRRELDSKHKFIEDLESNLKSARDERDDVNEKLSHSEKDRRSLKRQFQQLEHGTLAALEELAKDRDSAKNTSVDLKSKLDAAQKKIKSQEEDAERRHSIWEKETHSWEAEKRGYERRVHITETRLKTVLEELAAHHAAAQAHENGIEHEEEDNTRDSGVGDESDTASVQYSPMRKGTHHRTLSTSSRRSLNRIYRFSTQSVLGGDGPKTNGVSLADELQLDEEDEEEPEIEDDEDDFPEHELKARRALESRQSHYHDDKAKRVLGIMSEHRLQQPIEFDMRKSHDRDASIDFKSFRTEEYRAQYVDTGVQYSPPPSPLVAPVLKGLEKVPDVIPLFNDEQVEANQRKKRVSPTPPPLIDRGQQMSPVPDEPAVTMVSAGSQTLEERPLSPPATPKITPPTSPVQPVPVIEPVKPELVSISTQTDPPEEPKSPSFLASSPVRAPAPAPISIPSIAIHPPASAPPSPRETVLPPATKSVSCQTSSDLLAMFSVAVQTEEIRTDKRLQKLPPHLLPSFINSNPPTPEGGKQRSVSDKSPFSRPYFDRPSPRSGSPLPDNIPSSPPPMPSPPSVEQRYPGNNDNGPLNGERGDAPRRPFRNSSLFAGFDEEEEEEPERDEDSKAPSYQTPSMSMRALKHVRHFGKRPSPVPEDKEVESKPRPSESSPQEPSTQYPQSAPASGRTSLETKQSFEKSRNGKMASLRSGGLSRQTSIRRSAMIQNGAVAHAQRSRTPSIASVGSSRLSNGSVGPPFPVPDRGSSRRLFPQSKSEGSQSPTPRGGGLFGTRRGTAQRQLSRKDSLRKVRSATTIQRSNSRGRNRSRSPPLEPHPLSPSFPPLPEDNISAPQKIYPSQRSGEKSLSAQVADTTGKADVGRASQGTVIDAIAATMVGEWMWKYVRRRKSFGVQESPQDLMGRPGTDGSVNVTGNGVRHKRWVWLSPYERAVMWSTKQPASNSALMGKSGRKLVIQSVLDVRDDTPLPKNHGISEPFNRSILILTPARALKFTAMSRERHYTWLTALSFLAHSPLLAPGLPQPPEEPENDIDARNRAPSLRRTQIRDSVRIAKDKARPNPGAKLGLGSSSANRPSPTIHEWNGPVSTADTEPVPDAAEAPTVPRFAHGRKRSMTGPRLPSSVRSLAYTQVPTPTFPSSASSEFGGASFIAGSSRTSEASTGVRTNFLDAVGTVRMEAFVDGVENGGRTSQDSSIILGGGRSSRRNNRWSGSGSDPRRSGVVYTEEFDAFDPFRGF